MASSESAVTEYDFASFQADASRTLEPHRAMTPENFALVCLGLTGEAGEVADLAKKVIGHKHPLNIDRFKEELGDTLWYVAAICSLLGVSLAEVARGNIEKLQRRYPDGFEPSRSLNREPSYDSASL